jgi:hypothetical protein
VKGNDAATTDKEERLLRRKAARSAISRFPLQPPYWRGSRRITSYCIGTLYQVLQYYGNKKA